MMCSSNGIVKADAAVGWSSLSTTSLDTEPSSRYPITLEQARKRALHACKREREMSVKNIWMVCFLLAILLTSGCRFVAPIVDFIFVNPNAAVVEKKPESPQEQLLHAAKGTNWLVALSILGIGAGVFAFVNGSKIGIPVVVACAVSLFMALAVARFAMWMAVFGMVGAVAAVAISVIVKNKALKDVICNVQDIKESAANGGSKKSIQEDIKMTLTRQADSTKALVKKIKANL
ncbi:MAG: hypothetical protein IMZ47_04770 [Firmicutes bacterium]|nr:hypothetical protein [Bacillota bacterium]MBE3139416.1 hypothetical protein [Thermoplasmata archaeon]